MPKAAPSKPAPKKSARSSEPAAAPRPARIELIVDRALKQRWEKTLSAVSAARREGASAFDELWERVGEIVEHDPPLYLAGGYATEKAFYDEVLGETARNARRNMRVAKYASPAEEVRYGTSKLDAILTYLDAKNGGASPRARIPVDFDKLRIPVTRDGAPKNLPLDEATVQEIAAATRSIQRAGGGAAPKRSPLEAAVTRELKAAPLREVTVRVQAGRIALGRIAPEALPALAKALSRVKLPDGEE